MISIFKRRSRSPVVLIRICVCAFGLGSRGVPRTGWIAANREFEQGWKAGDRRLYAAVRGEQSPGRMAGQARQAACAGAGCGLAD